MVSENTQVVSRQRVTDHGEVFTSLREVNAMLDLVKQETVRIESRFLEPACGHGNFLAEILRRKLAVIKKKYSGSQIEFERYSVLAVSSIYGIDILKDNVHDCRKRLFDIFNAAYTNLYGKHCKEECRRAVQFILEKNIVWGDALSLTAVHDKKVPIVFSEWSLVTGSQIKRRDFAFHELIKDDSKDELPLFSNSERAFIPDPIKEFPLTHFLRIADVEKD